MSFDGVKTFNVLLGGYINVNVIDGSAFFLSGFAGMCARNPYVNVDLVTANPVNSWEVLDELAEYSNVDIIDPYSMVGSHPEFLDRSQMSRKEYASVLASTFDRKTYDAVLIRDNEVALEFLNYVPEASARTFAYVTGLTFLGDEQDPEQLGTLEQILTLGGKLVCQTQEIKELVGSHLHVNEEDLYILPPHVPDPEKGALNWLKRVERPNRLVYTGKFFRDWKVDSILASLKSANLDGADLHLDVAGDQFRHADEDSFFVENVSYLLKNTSGVTWHGRVPRNISRALISNSHVGVGWRSERLDQSTELSTKVLEYGALGRPSIINRTRMHERLLGGDYPLFVNSMSDFRTLLRQLKTSGAAVTEAAERCFSLAQKHSYTTISQEFLPSLGNQPSRVADHTTIVEAGLATRIPEELRGRPGRATINGIWAEFVLDSDSRRTVGELASEIERDFQSWKHSIGVTRSRIETFVKSDSLGSLGERNQSVRLESQDFENVKTLRDSLDSARKAREDAEAKLATVKRDLERALEREQYWRGYSEKQLRSLNALRNSKLGRLQTLVWRKTNKK